MTSTTDSPAVDLEEKIARLIDPSSWSVFDGYLADVKRKYQGESIGFDPDAFKDKASLAKAREILALLSQARALPRDGEWVLVPREPTEAMIEAYCARLNELGFTAWVNASTVWEVMLSALPPAGEVGSDQLYGQANVWLAEDDFNEAGCWTVAFQAPNTVICSTREMALQRAREGAYLVVEKPPSFAPAWSVETRFAATEPTPFPGEVELRAAARKGAVYLRLAGAALRERGLASDADALDRKAAAIDAAFTTRRAQTEDE